MVYFVFGKTIAELGSVVECEGEFQVAIEAHFVLQSLVHVGFHVLAFDKMTAAGVCPQSARMILRLSAFLHQNFACAVEYHNRERTMKQSLLVDKEFRRITGDNVIGRYEGYVFHGEMFDGERAKIIAPKP